MNQKARLYRLAICLLWVCCILAACTRGAPDHSADTVLPPVAQTQQPAPDATPTGGLSEYGQETFIPPANSLSTQHVGIENNAAKKRVLDLIKNNGKCKLPCLLGFTPNQTNSQTLAKFVKEFKPSSPGAVLSPETSLIYPLSNDIAESVTLIYQQEKLFARIEWIAHKTDGAIDRMHLTGEIHNRIEEDPLASVPPAYENSYVLEVFGDYRLSKILSDYGKPTNVYIKTFEDIEYASRAKIPFSLVLVNDRHGFLIEYIFPREVENGFFIGCPDQFASISVTTWDPSMKFTLEQLGSVVSGFELNQASVPYYKSIDRSTDMSLDEFFNIFHKTSNKECIKTPAHIWPR